jgi:hypothetical protein
MPAPSTGLHRRATALLQHAANATTRVTRLRLAAVMSCINEPQITAHKTSSISSHSNEPATLKEHFVLHRLSKEEVMIFDLDIEDTNANTSNNHSNRRMSALDAATTIVMEECQRQRCVSAPAKINTPTAGTTTPHTASTADGLLTISNPAPETEAGPEAEAETETETKLRAALAASLEPTAPFNSTTMDSNSKFGTSPGHITFGPKQLSALSPDIQDEETKRQETLVKTRSTASLTIQKRRFLLADEAAAIREEEVVMSGALDWADVRCEVFAARERAMSGLEEAGIVAL